MQLFMDGARFDDDYDNGNKYTLDSLFRRVLCEYSFGFPSSQCGDPVKDRLKVISPAPTKSPTIEPTYDPTLDPTTGTLQ